MASKLFTGASMPAISPIGDLITSTTGVKSRAGSYGRLLYMNLFSAACACDANSSVEPSGAALTTAAAAGLPPPPARFSTTNGCPSSSLKTCAISRANRSAVPPAGNGTTIVTGRLGQACAETARGESSTAAIAKAMKRSPIVTVQLTGAGPRSGFDRFGRDRCLRLAMDGSRTACDAPDGFPDRFRIGAFDALDRPAFDGDALHVATLREVIVDSVMLGGAVVPHDQGVWRPVMPELIFRDLRLLKQDIEQ